jgi:hypothetical protein
VGAVLCVVSGIGYGISAHQERVALEQVQAQAGNSLRIQLGETRPARVLPALLTALGQDDADPVCRLLAPEPKAQLLSVLQVNSCPEAVAELHRRAAAEPVPDESTLPAPQPSGSDWIVDACPTVWGRVAGPDLGRIVVAQTDPAVQRFAISAFSAC